MRQLICRLMEPKHAIPEGRKIFSNHDIKILIVPLFLEQLLGVLVGVADTFMVSYAGEAAVSGVSLVNMFNTVFLFLFSALRQAELWWSASTSGAGTRRLPVLRRGSW